MQVATDVPKWFTSSWDTCVLFSQQKGQEGDLLLQHVFSKVALSDASGTALREPAAYQALCHVASALRVPRPECPPGRGVWDGGREDLTGRLALVRVPKGEEERIR